MEKVSVDLFDVAGVSYVVLVDRYSGYPWVARLASTTTEAVCQVLLRWFCEAGFPERVKTDNGPQFRGPFKEFCAQYSIRHDTSAPYNPQSNGLAEAAVKAMKHLLLKVGKDVSGVEFRLALLAWRTAPRADGVSPAYTFYGRHLRTQLPDARAPLVPAAVALGPAAPAFAAERGQAAQRVAVRGGGRELPSLAAGDLVHYQKMGEGRWSEGGRVLEALAGGRSYLVATPTGDFRKNRRHLRPATVVPEQVAVPQVPQVAVPQVPRVPHVAVPNPVGLAPAWLGTRALRAPAGPRRSRRNVHGKFQL
jgi:hypothetical protein